MDLGPTKLRADNFTPVSRTPWGGRRLRRGIKAACHVRPEREQEVIGESWEVSVEPDFPAQLEADGQPLAEWLSAHGEAALGDEHRRGRDATALLVKLLDTAEPLSLQIHPADDYAGLSPGEAGKPESWYVVHAERDAALYLGFTPGTTRAEVERALETGEMRRHMARVPVAPGDFFVIDAGTPHAIGEGLTLVEPQHVLPGSRGLTYRYWDWDRRYDAQGRPDPEGAPRALHVEDALAVTAWERVSAAGFADSIRLRAGAPQPQAAARIEPLCGPQGGLASAWLQVWRAHGTGPCLAPDVPLLRSLSVLAGEVRIPCGGGELRVQRGESAVLPASLGACSLELREAHAVLASVV